MHARPSRFLLACDLGVRGALLPFLSLLLAACASKQYDDPIAVMLDRQAGFSDRRSAAAQAEAAMPSDPRRLAALEKLLWDPKYLPWQRQYAIDQLLIHDPQFKAKLDRRIVLIRNWPTRQYVFDLAVEKGWKDFTPAIVRAYAQPAHGMNDAARPERTAIEAMHPGRPVEEVIFDIFANPDSGYGYTQQVAAWSLLCRLRDTSALREHLVALSGSDGLAADLKLISEALHVLPRNKEGVLWMMHLRAPGQRKFWDVAARRVGALDAEQRDGLAMRHLGPLVHADAGVRSQTRAELARAVARRLQGREHVYKGPTFDAPLTDHPQRYADWVKHLAWADLATINLVLDLFANDKIVRALFQQRDRDQIDITSEHGGVLRFTDTGPEARAYAPLIRVNDWKYVPSPEMMEDLYTAVAHYHFHAQRERNERHAGPGRGDMRMADAVRTSCVVLTSVANNRINVDYYQPEGVVVDLGTIVRRQGVTPPS